MTDTPLVELRCHTAYSFGDGAMTPEALVQRAAELGYTALGLTDTADLGGVIRFGAACAEHGVTPIAGAELVVDGRPLAVLARTQQGYRNLAALVTQSRSGALCDAASPRPRRGSPRLTWSDVTPRATGLQLLTGPPSGMLAYLVRTGRSHEANALLAHWCHCFDGHVAVEVQCHHTGGDEMALATALIALAERASVPWLVAQDPRYLDHGGRLVHDMHTALRQTITLDQLLRQGGGHPNGNWRLLPPEAVRDTWHDRPEGLVAAAALASQCACDLSWVRPPLPAFPVPVPHTDDSFLRDRTLAGAHQRWGMTLTPAQHAQLDHELQVIAELGFSGFFLVMWDAVRYAGSVGILCQGRGSAANSAVAYCLGITAVDPVANGLLFERFLSAGRVGGHTEAPDIDVDFEHDRREEVLDYVYGRYDRTRSAITAVTQVYSAPTALHDAMRALGYPAELAFALSKRLHYHSSKEGAAALASELGPRQGFDLTTPRARTLLAIMYACDGLPRLRSTHPGGFVLSAAPLGEHAPIEWTTMGRSILQFDKDDLDVVGIPKFDFLGLGGLSAVRRAFDAIEIRTGQRPAMYQLPIDDRPTYELISRGDTLGTFQIESRAQIASILQTRPERLYDITVQVALIRPGPIQARFVPPYTNRRRGREAVTYADPRLEPILARTQGIPIFQEQAMAIAMAMGGYTPVEADMLRRTMGNQRKEALLVAALAGLRERMIARDVPPPVAEQIEGDLRSFANYGFPESHAWSFALIAYATAWLKTNYPTEFYLGLLNSQPMGFYSVSTLLQDARRHGVTLLPPCLLGGARDCTIAFADSPPPSSSTGSHALPLPPLRVGWRFIRGLGTAHLDALERAQRARPFDNIGDVVHRAGLDRTPAIALARADAFAAWEPDRRRAAWEALRAAGDTMPLAPTDEAILDVSPVSRHRRILADYFATGFCLDGHPMEVLRAKLDRLGVTHAQSVTALPHGARVVVAGLIIARQRPQTANGTVFLLLEDEFGHLNVIVPNSIEGQDRDTVKYAMVILVLGRIERDGPVLQVVGERFQPVQIAGLTHNSRDFR